MLISLVKREITFAILFLVFTAAAWAQSPPGVSASKPLEVSEADGVPVILKHLPAYESIAQKARFINSKTQLWEAIGERRVLDPIIFGAGTEAAFAAYPAGNLLIVEYTNPQASIDTDAAVLNLISQSPGDAPTAYRRVGNYNVFVFDGPDEAAAAALVDQIRYQKMVHWLGDDPYMLKRLERYMAVTTRDIALSTVYFIVVGLLAAAAAGIIAGLIYFRFRDQRRANSAAFSDAGGLTRLNLDGLSESVLPE